MAFTISFISLHIVRCSGHFSKALWSALLETESGSSANFCQKTLTVMQEQHLILKGGGACALTTFFPVKTEQNWSKYGNFLKKTLHTEKH